MYKISRCVVSKIFHEFDPDMFECDASAETICAGHAFYRCCYYIYTERKFLEFA